MPAPQPPNCDAETQQVSDMPLGKSLAAYLGGGEGTQAWQPLPT